MPKPQVKVAFASGPQELNQAFLDRMLALYPELPLRVVSEFPPHAGEWMPYHVNRSFLDNLRQCRAALKGTRIRLAGTLLVPQSPYPHMHLMALLLAPRGFLAFNENLDSFMLRPRSAAAVARHLWWRVKSALRFHLALRLRHFLCVEPLRQLGLARRTIPFLEGLGRDLALDQQLGKLPALRLALDWHREISPNV
jgi:hypothetical protein